MTIGEIRAEVDAATAVLDRLAGSYLTGAQQIRDAAAALSRAGKDSNRPELSGSVATAHLAAQEAGQTAATAGEARRLCSAYAWQL